MTNINNEIQPESSKNNILENTKVMCILDDKKMKSIMKKFKNCTKIKNSNILTKQVEGVKKLYEIFREFIKDSLDFNKRLKNYSLDILFFTECFNDNNCSDEDILVLLKDLLKESKKNHGLAKGLERRLFVDEEDGIMNELKKIKSSLQGHILDFKTKINSEEKVLISYEGGVFYSLCIGILLKVASLIDLVTNEKSYEEAVINIAENWLEEEREEIRNQLKNNQNELNMINLFDDNLKTIIIGVGKIRTFWNAQIEIIEYLIENLERFGKGQHIQRRRIVRVLEQRWKNVERECQIYNEAMNDLLHDEYIEV
ncbi:2845_t:CDS:2 [Rhizophagus irregularis]|nr:2845_t:CDS:2 [Rhizophagus irregularis]